MDATSVGNPFFVAEDSSCFYSTVHFQHWYSLKVADASLSELGRHPAETKVLLHRRLRVNLIHGNVLF